MSGPSPSDVDHKPDALMAAAEAFLAARSARRLLDEAGRLGAAAVVRSRPIPGARRASSKAQASLEESAHKLEEARDRWAALMRGIAVDLNIDPEQLADQVEAHAFEIALADLEVSLLACREVGRALGAAETGALESAQQAVQALRNAPAASAASGTPAAAGTQES
jgi:hypothetical protein